MPIDCTRSGAASLDDDDDMLLVLMLIVLVFDLTLLIMDILHDT